MSTPLNPSWTAEADFILKEGHKAKRSARDIAAELTASGHKATRNSVLGRAHRLGLSKPMEKPKPRPANGVLFEETTSRQCMWIGQEDARTAPVVCCGKRVAAPGEPWCPTHRAIAWAGKPEKPVAKPQRQGTGLFGSAPSPTIST